MASNYGYGKRKELQVAELIERKADRCEWSRSQGSRGAVDLEMDCSRARLAVQVKATRKGEISSSRVQTDERRQLVRRARQTGRRPAIAYVSRNYAWLVDARTERVILEGELRPLKYIYPEEK